MRAGFIIPPPPKTPEAIMYRCDYCGGHLGLIVDRYYRMRFCCKAHMSAYKQRLTMETRAKIRQPDIADNFRRAADYVNRISKGTKPGDLPVQQPTKVELIINAALAKAIGVTLPTSLLLRADGVIE